jgi:hypothetical protein
VGSGRGVVVVVVANPKNLNFKMKEKDEGGKSEWT